MEIGFFCYSPASINICIALLKWNRGNKNIIYFKNENAKKIFLNMYKGDNYIEEIDEEKFYKKEVDYFIYNTGSGDEIERLFPYQIKKRGSKALIVAINDIFWDTEEGLFQRYKCIPDILIVQTKREKEIISRRTLLKEKNIYVLGNPHFDRLKNIKREAEREKYVSFISQCENGGSYIEETKKECKEAIIELIKMKKKGTIKELIVFKHPRESEDFFKKNDIKTSDMNRFEEMIKSEYIISDGSTPHYEAAMLGIKNLFLKNGNLENRILKKETDEIKHVLEFNSTEKIYELLKKIKKT